MIGRTTSDEIALSAPNPIARPRDTHLTLKQATQSLDLVAIPFGPLSVGPQQKAAVQRRLLRSRLRARLPGPLEVPERTTQERMLRDIGMTRGTAVREAAKPFWAE